MCVNKLLFYIIICLLVVNGEIFIENFIKSDANLSLWMEHSDTVMKVGKSKSSFVLQKTDTYQRAVLFTLLNPQSCGAAFAGIKKDVSMDFSKHTTISLQLRGQGQYQGYEFILKHKGDRGIKVPTYCQFFEAPSEFQEVSLLLKDFKPYSTGILLENSIPLDQSQITSVGILAYGGAHQASKQFGVASLEIDWIKIH